MSPYKSIEESWKFVPIAFDQIVPETYFGELKSMWVAYKFYYTLIYKIR